MVGWVGEAKVWGKKKRWAGINHTTDKEYWKQRCYCGESGGREAEE